VRTVTRWLLTTGAVAIWVCAGAAQAPGPSGHARGAPEPVEGGPRPAVLIREIRRGPLEDPARSPAAMVDRLESFDANRDQRISRDELPERMQGLVARGDRNADAVLDWEEIRALVNLGAADHVSVNVRAQSFEGLQGVVKDLKLSRKKHELALWIVGRHALPRDLNEATRSPLFGEMRAVLDDQEYEDFVAATARLSRRPIISVR